MKIYLVRHPKPAVEPGTCYGALDVGVDPQDAAALLAHLRAVLPRTAALASSPLRRCAQTADALHAAGWPAPQLDARLAEMSFGAWEGCRWDDIAREQIDAWSADVAGYRPPGGETVAELAERAAAALRELAAQHARAGALVAITHAGVLQTAPRVLARRPLAGFGGTRVGYGAVIVLRRDGDVFLPDGT